MHGRRQPPLGRYGLRNLRVDEPKNERQNRTDQESRSDWKIEREVLMRHDDVARQAPSLSGPVPLRCDGVDAPAPASGSIESCAKMVNPLKERRP